MTEYEIAMATPFHRDVLRVFFRDGYTRLYKVSGDDTIQRYRFGVLEAQISVFSSTAYKLMTLGKIIGVAVVVSKKSMVCFCNFCGYNEDASSYIKFHCNTPMLVFETLTIQDIQSAYETNEILLYYIVGNHFVETGWHEVQISKMTEERVEVALVQRVSLRSGLSLSSSIKTKLRRCISEIS